MDVPRDAQLDAFEHIPLPVQVWRLEGPNALRIVAANPASERVLGVGARAAGSTVEEGFSALRSTGVVEMGARVARTGEPATLDEVRVEGPEGAVRMAVNAFALGEGRVGLAFKEMNTLEEERERFRRMRTIYTAMLDCVPNTTFAKAAEDRTYLFVNKACSAFAGVPREGLVGKHNRDLLPEDVAAEFERVDSKVYVDHETITYEDVVPYAGEVRTFLTVKTPIRDEGGRVIGLAGFGQDVTDARRAEEALRKGLAELEAVRGELLETVRELSTPVLPIHDGVLILPLVGKINSERSDQFRDALLGGIQKYNAHTVIIDITGVRIVDTAVANHLIQGTRAASLLGTECVLVGIAPQVASTLVHIGIDFGPIVIQRDLQAGITYALGRQQAR